MKPLFSDEERAASNKTFIIARYNHELAIDDFKLIVPYFNDKRIRPLCDLNRSYNTGNIIAINGRQQYEYIYNESDARIYFEWLVAVITGAEPASEEILKKANDQLFQFIHALGPSTRLGKNVQLMEPYDWQNLFHSFDHELIDIKNTVDRHDREIVNILKLVLEMLKKNMNFLETQQKDYDALFSPKAPKGEPT